MEDGEGDHSGNERHDEVYTQVRRLPNSVSIRNRRNMRAPVNDGEAFAVHSEGHSSGPSQRDNEGASGSRGTRSSGRDNGGGSGPRDPLTPSNEEDNITELLDQSGKERHKVYTQFDSGPYWCRNCFNKCLRCGAPVNDGGTLVAPSEGHSSGPSQRDNEGGSGSRGTKSSWQDNGGGSGPQGPPTPSNKDENNWFSQFLENRRNLFLVALFAFIFMFFLFLFLFLCLFVFLFYVK